MFPKAGFIWWEIQQKLLNCEIVILFNWILILYNLIYCCDDKKKFATIYYKKQQ